MRWFAIVLGIIFLFWIPFEDNGTEFVILFSIALCTWGAALFLSGGRKPFRKELINYALAGTLAGLLVTPLALFLFAFKTSLHSHPNSDYTFQQFLSVIARTPIWLVGGFFVGLGSGLYLSYRKPDL